MPAGLDTLARVIAALSEGRPVHVADGMIAGPALARMIARRVSIEEALGAEPENGTSSRRAFAAAERARLVRMCRARFFPGRGGAGQMADALGQYAGSGWARDREAGVCPARYAGKAEEMFFSILQLGGSLKERRIREIGTDPRCSLPICSPTIHTKSRGPTL
ncbi:MAG: hypothetical protein ABJP67_14490 [Nitratireductor sp.]|uniref:hypothetical protein n=1 Tax=Bauldia litoralis TaxID=665467 RepID=UPI003264E035